MNDRLAVYFDAQVFDHETGYGLFGCPPSPYLVVSERHPENGERVRNMASVLRKGPIRDALTWHGASPASDEALRLFHDGGYLDGLAAVAQEDSYRNTDSTIFGPGTWPIIKVAAGLSIAAAEHVWQGKGPMAYALSRPPGHHAQPAMADGYCFVNNIGVAIEVLREQGMKRAAVIDWDVHHGNGTQEGFYSDPDVLTVSLHMDHGSWGPTHVQTGAADEIGAGEGKGANLNVPLPYGSGNGLYLAVFDQIVAPAVREFAPEVLFIAAGQDANQFDPNGRQTVNMEGFYQLGQRARSLAAELCGGKIVLVQEGGYALSYAAYCLHATLEGVLGRPRELDDPIAFMPDHTENLAASIQRLRDIREAALL
ncbi:MAG: class II histone deacetylase [Rhodospirillales bacterium]|nr:class II histone deacetylase [Rhodospirillales bacterium]